MARSDYKKVVQKEANKQFFLYVFFHSIWTSIITAFED